MSKQGTFCSREIRKAKNTIALKGRVFSISASNFLAQVLKFKRRKHRVMSRP